MQEWTTCFILQFLSNVHAYCTCFCVCFIDVNQAYLLFSPRGKPLMANKGTKFLNLKQAFLCIQLIYEIFITFLTNNLFQYLMKTLSKLSDFLLLLRSLLVFWWLQGVLEYKTDQNLVHNNTYLIKANSMISCKHFMLIRSNWQTYLELF